MYNILICDDEPDIVSALSIYLSTEPYAIFTASTGKEALHMVNHQEIHLILMDVMMPEMDGISAMMKLREHSNIPVILLTAKSEDTDKILGLNMGADDYITKPFNPIEVLARVRSQLRRYTSLGSMEKKSTRLTIGGISIDDECKMVYVDEEPITLTPSEYKILQFLMENAGHVFSSTQLYERIWHEDALGSSGTVAVHIRHLREKLEINPSEPRYLKVVWGLGYKIEKDVK
ncbi:response regulator transcription factor [Chakrabartyella piscis]|uniref:response regulator transcription factor n=1 Tax=Chakrabartyella piscis TaxID=2918914 RepID=UPI00295882A3|nr:response regulator transcription factor [Chakrabartyella piscis]